MSEDSIQIASISRALVILDLLASEARDFGVTEVSSTLGISKPVVSRYSRCWRTKANWSETRSRDSTHSP